MTKWFTALLIALISCQSGIAIGDATPSNAPKKSEKSESCVTCLDQEKTDELSLKITKCRKYKAELEYCTKVRDLLIKRPVPEVDSKVEQMLENRWVRFGLGFLVGFAVGYVGYDVVHENRDK